MPRTPTAHLPGELLQRWLLREAPDDVDLFPADARPPTPSVRRSGDASARPGTGSRDGPTPDPGVGARDVRAGLKRRRLVVAGTLVVGAGLLGWSLTREPGDPWFVVATVLLALVWAAGARLSGHVSLGWWQTPSGRHRRPALPGLVIGLAAVAVFCAGAVVVARLGPLREAVLDVLAHVQWSNLPVVLAVALLNGVAEELFFRGALHHAVESADARRRWRPVVVSTLLYAAVTAASGNVMLVFAAAVLGLLCSLHRRATGGVLGPVVIHVVWSVGMVLLLRPLLDLLG